MNTIKPTSYGLTRPGGTDRRRPAIFLDRDGTLIPDRGDMGDPAAVEFLPGVVELLREVQKRFALFIVTNQSAVSAGRLAMEQVVAVNDAVVDRLRDAGVTIERVFICPHSRTDGCDCIKPKPHFLKVAAHEHGIDLERSFTVGDHPHDAELAHSAGAKGVYVLTGHGLKHLGELGSGFVVVPCLADARRAFAEGSSEGAHDGIERAARMLRRGEVVAFPTETVYGLGANALYPKAVARLFEIEQRPTFDPLVVHIDEPAWVERLAREIPPPAARLMRTFWPGPLTVVLPKTSLVPDLVTAGLETVALRMPAHETALSLIRATGVPICASSADHFSYVGPTRAEHIGVQLAGAVKCVVDGGPCAIGIEPTVVGFAVSGPRILRPGAVSAEEMRAALGEDIVQESHSHCVLAPGMLPRHYSPRVPIRLFEGSIPPPPTSSSGLLLQRRREAPQGYLVVEILSERGDLAEVAHNLFASLRRFDKEPVEMIVAEAAPERGIGRAINDRLRRGSCRF